MPPQNVEVVCAVCQREKYMLAAIDVTSLVAGELFERVNPIMQKQGWAVRKNPDKRIDLYFVGPECLTKEKLLLGTMAEFKEETRCPKCWCTNASTKYKAGTEVDALVSTEYLERCCKVCGYRWAQKVKSDE